MDAKDLRIGNHILFKGDVCIVEADDIADIVICNYKHKNEEDWQPIAITHEILEKCGFVQLNHTILKRYCLNDKYDREKFWLSYDDNGLFVTLFERTVRVNHVHQLQNIYYYAMIEELEIKIQL